MLTVNNFFVDIVKEISVTKYESDKEIIPTFSLYKIYQYSESMLKILPKDSLKKIVSKVSTSTVHQLIEESTRELVS